MDLSVVTREDSLERGDLLSPKGPNSRDSHSKDNDCLSIIVFMCRSMYAHVPDLFGPFLLPASSFFGAASVVLSFVVLSFGEGRRTTNRQKASHPGPPRAGWTPSNATL